MADNRTMAQMLQAPIEGYEDAIVVPPINANNFELKQPLINLVQSNKFTGRQDPHNHLRFFNKVTSTFRHPEVPNTSIKLLLFPFSLDGEARDWLDKEPPRSILTWDDLVSKFINQYFPPSKTTYYRNEIITFYQKPNEAFNDRQNDKDVEIKSSSNFTLTLPEESEFEADFEKDSIPPGIDLTLPPTLEVSSSNLTFPTLTGEKDLKKDLTVSFDFFDSRILPLHLLDSDSPFTAKLSASVTLNSLGNEDKVFKPVIPPDKCLNFEPNLVMKNVVLNENFYQNNVEDVNSFTFIIWTFLPYFTYPEESPLIFSFRSANFVFDPGIVTFHKPVIVTTSRYVVPTGRVKVPAGRYVVPTGKDNVIVSTGRSKVISAGRTILVLVVLCSELIV
ncbi:reverse transcriptase domain-containing protein [Tanacetum coccineum]